MSAQASFDAYFVRLANITADRLEGQMHSSKPEGIDLEALDRLIHCVRALQP